MIKGSPKSKEQLKQSVALNSAIASAVLTVMKAIVGVLTGSMAVLSEAIQSGIDLTAGILTYFAVRQGDKPADAKHTYGYAKIESVSAFIETGLLFVTCGWIIYEASQRLFVKTVEVNPAWYAYAVLVISIIVNFSRAKALTKVAKETKSPALEADALNFNMDNLSSVMVIVGLVFVSFGFPLADPIAAICVSIFIAYAAYKLGKRTLDALIDTAPEGATLRITEEAKKIDGVLGVEKLRVRPAGATVFAEMVVTVSRKLSQEQVDSICSRIEKRIKHSIPEADIMVRAKPVTLNNETIIERIQIIAANHGLSVHDITIHILSGKKYVTFHAEVDTAYTVEKAHKAVSKLERQLMDELGDEVDICAHAEPYNAGIAEGVELPPEEVTMLAKKIGEMAKQLNLVKEVHGVKARKVDGRLFISFHCVYDGKTPLEEAHKQASTFEYLVKGNIPLTKRVVVHIEPPGFK